MYIELLNTILPLSSDLSIRYKITTFLQKDNFRSFACKYSDKIKSKFNSAKTTNDKLDVLAELEFVHLYIDDFINIGYEPWGTDKRAPDFLVHIKDDIKICVEVRRIRYNPDLLKEIDEIETEILYKGNESFKFTDIIFEKVGQLKPDIANIIYVRSDSITHEAFDASNALIEMRSLILSSDHQFIIDKSKGHYNKTDEFLKDYSKLSAIIVRDDWIREGRSKPEAKVFLNPDAKLQLGYETISMFEQ